MLKFPGIFSRGAIETLRSPLRRRSWVTDECTASWPRGAAGLKSKGANSTTPGSVSEELFATKIFKTTKNENKHKKYTEEILLLEIWRRFEKMGHRILVGFILGVIADKALVNVDIDENSYIGTEITRLSYGFKYSQNHS